MRLILVTGLSGAGKSQALRYIEDMGFFCVDNLPPSMLAEFVRTCLKENRLSRVAVGVDVRGSLFFDELPSALQELKELGIKCEILFLDASRDTLLKRYKETRRLHPLQYAGGLREAIEEDIRLTYGLREAADYTIDTSLLLVRQLKERVTTLLADTEDESGDRKLHISILSFGYKYGIPAEADIVYDMRFIPNPFHVPELKHHTGKDADVREYVFSCGESKVFLRETLRILEYLIPCYISEGKNDLVIAVGCTGGMHRSVVMADELGDMLSRMDYRVSVIHRDIEKDRKNG